jgi:hypothetical protein
MRTKTPSIPALAGAVIPAYLFPATTTALNALVIPDPEIAARVGIAAWTTIAIPSAVMAGIVAIVTSRRTPPVPSARATARAFFLAALAGALLAGAATAVLIGNEILHVSDLQFTLLSGALGGGLAARRWARSSRPRRSRKSTAGSTRPGVVAECPSPAGTGLS